MNHIVAAPVRETVQVRLPDGRAFDGPLGTTVEAFLLTAVPEAMTRDHIVGVLCDGHLRELAQPLNSDAHLVPLTTRDPDGARIYRRSLSFLMIAAAAEVFPGQVITVQHSMPFGGYYCERDDNTRVTLEELDHLRCSARSIRAGRLQDTVRRGAGSTLKDGLKERLASEFMGSPHGAVRESALGPSPGRISSVRSRAAR